MLSAWTKHLEKDPQAKEDFANYVLGSKALISRLNDILDEIESNLERSELNKESFENSNWAYVQAFRLGHKAMIEKIKTIISID